MTSAYFLAFAAVQIPAGMLLDRYGPRRVEPVLLAVAGTGALLFAIAEDVAGTVLARALIGAGCRRVPDGADEGDRQRGIPSRARRRSPAG